MKYQGVEIMMSGYDPRANWTDYCNNLSHKTDFEGLFDISCGVFIILNFIVMAIGLSLMLKKIRFRIKL
jgi:hypothetical protein